MLQNFLLKITTMLGKTADDYKTGYEKNEESKWIRDIVKPVVSIIDQLLIPIMIMLGVFGAIYAITLGVQYSRAESGDKRDELKKRMINGAIGIVITLILLILMKIFINESHTIAGWIDDMAGVND